MQIVRIVWHSGTPDTTRFSNFGEDLCRLSWSEPHYHVDEKTIAVATDTIDFRCRRSMVGNAVAATELLLGRHGLAEVCRVDIVEEA